MVHNGMIKFLYQPVDAAILIYFRIVAGILMAQELINSLVIGKFSVYTDPKFHFSYQYFDWIKPWPYWGMVVHFAITIFAGFAVAFNYHYKVFSFILFAGYSSLFLMEATEYINHTYLYCLVSFWMMFLPLHKSKNSAPAWMLYLLLFHMGLAYFFGGVAKLNSDWLMGTPMDIYLSARKDYPLGFLYSQQWAPYVFSYGGIIFDLLIVPLLIYRPTRPLALIASILFHVSNMLMFGLATFPWFSLLLTTMFFDPSWPRKVPILRKFMPWNIELAPDYKPNYALVSVLAIYVLVHVSLPFRHLLYQGNTSWTEQGHMFSWRMMLRDKQGSALFFVRSKKDQHMELVDHTEFITHRQYEDIIGKPDLILNFAHFLRDHYQEKLGTEVAIFASSRVSLNGRPPREMISQGVDLAKENRTLLPYNWIRPLEVVSRETANR